MRTLVGAILLIAGSVYGATTDVKIFVDTDRNTSTGCRVITISGNFDGVEQIFTTTYDNTTMTVTGVTRQQCVDPTTATFSAPATIDAGGWPVATNGGLQSLETRFAAGLVGGVHSMRFGFGASTGTLTDAMLQQPGGGSIIFTPDFNIPGRHHAVSPGTPVPITIDGNVGDWNGIASLVGGSSGSGSPSFRFVGIAANATSDNFYFLFTIQANRNAPTAVDDTYTLLRGGTLTIGAPGILANDSDPNGKPLSASLLSGPEHGTLSLGSNGGFTYTNDGAAAPTDSFRYKATNGTDDSNAARVIFSILSGTPPVITSPNAVTFTVGTPGSFTFTATGNPTPAISISGTLPTGVTFNGATHSISGTPAAGTGKSYALVVTASSPAGTATQNFTLNVNEAPAITTAATNQTVCAGTTATFTAASSGFPTPVIQWQVSTNGGVTFTNIAGAITGSYSFTAAATDNNNQYRATFTNALGTVNTTATLTVNTPAVVTAQPANQTVCAGANATFTAAASGTTAPAVQWQVSSDGGATFTNIAGATAATYTFATTNADNSKQYRATFTNACATVNSNAATLTVNSAPAVTTNPASQTVCNNTTATFTAAATGTPAPTVQWQVSLDNGATFNNLAGATTPTLSFTATTADNTKQYRAVFTNSCGTANSAAATLTVTTVPVVTTNPATQTICAGAPVTFTAATSSPATTVQWQRSTDGGATFNNITGATTTTLTFTTAASDSGNQYRAVFTNLCGTTNTTAATLTVNVAAAVTTQPVNQTVCDTQTATFTAAASGTPAPTVQWQVSSGGPFANIPGATSTTLSFAATAADNGKQYRAVFTNSCATVNTNAATLTVNTPPVVTTNPLTQTICAGNLANFTVVATGQPTPTVQWQLSIDGGATFNNIALATLTSYSFTAQPTDNGHRYRAVLTNVCGTATTTAATLTVTTAPAVTADPASLAVCAGTGASFTSTASGSPTPTVQWQVSSDGGTTFTNVPGATSTTLNLPPTTAGQNGNLYHAVFTNACGTATSANATLTVNTAPAVTLPPASHAACQNTGTTFTAAASGQPTPTVQWQVSSGGPFADIPGATSTTLTLANVTLADNGKQYQAVFTNTCGTATTTAATLTVDQAIVINTQPTDQSVTANTPVTFTAAASNFTSVQWVVSTDGGTIFNNVSGATAQTLTYSPPLSDNGKKFKAVYTNGCGTVETNVVTLTVTCPTITVARNGGGSFPNGIFNTVYAGQSVTSTGGAGTVSYAVTAGALPTGLSLATNGAISGSTTATGTFSFTVTATDSNLCTGAQSFSIAVRPVAGPDSYNNIVNNTQAAVTGGGTASPATPFVALTGSILANDLPGGGVTVTAGTFSSANGTNNVVIASDGTFLYTPPVTATALTTDSFTYTIGSDTGATGTPTTATGTVTLNLSGRVWYVKNNGSNGNGQSQSPFNSTTTFSTGARIGPDTAGDIIFVYTGDGNTTNQSDGVVLLANEQLIGQGVALVVNGNNLVPAAAAPQITNSTAGSDGVTLNDGNTVRGITVTGATRDGIAGASHTGFTADTLTIQNNASNALNLNAMNGTVSVNATISGSSSTLVTIVGGTGTTTLAGSITSSFAGGIILTASGRSTGSLLVPADITGNSGGVIVVQNNTGGTFTFSGTQTMNSGPTGVGVGLQNNTGATINFTGTLSIAAGAAGSVSFNATGGGTVNVTGSNNTITSAGSAILLNGVAIGANGMTFKSVSSTGNSAISLTSVTTAGGALTITGDGATAGTGGTINSPSGTAVSITSSPTITTSLSFMNITGSTTGVGGTSFGTINVASVALTGAPALSLNTGTLNGTFSSVNSSSPGVGVLLQSVNSTSPPLLINGGSITGQFVVSGGNISITDAGSITQPSGGGTGIGVDGGHTGALIFNGPITAAVANPGMQFSNADGSYTFNSTATLTGTNIIIDAGTDLVNGSQGTFTFGAGVSVSNSTNADLSIVGSSPSVTFSGTLSKTGATAGNLISITNQVNSVRTITIGGTLTDSSGAATAINLASNAGTITINNPSLSGFGAAAPIFLSANTGSMTINGGSIGITTNTFPAIAISTGSGSTTISGMTITTSSSGSGGVSSSNYTGTLTLTNDSITVNGGASGVGVTMTLGTLAGTGTTVSSQGPGLVLSTVALGSGAGMTSVTSSGGTNGISLNTVSGGPYTIGGGSLTGNSGAAFLVSGGTVSMTYGGTITQNSAARLVDISSTAGGTISFTDGVTGLTAGASSTGINISSANSNVTFTKLTLGTNGSRMTNQAVTIANGNATSTYNLGTISVFTNNAKGIVATGFDGNLNISGGSVDSSSATAIDINGPGGLTTLGVSLTSVTSAGGTADGISIQNTNGSFTINGDGVNTTAGGNGTGGTISNKSGADGNATQGIGIYLNSVTNITLRRMTINGTNQNYGIRGFSVAGFILEYSTVAGTNGTAATFASPEIYGEGSVYFGNRATKGVSGTVTFTKDLISGGRAQNLSFVNGGGAAATTTLTVKGCTFGAEQSFADAHASFWVEERIGGSTFNSTFGGPLAGEANTMTSAVGDLAHFQGEVGTTMDVQFKNNALSDTHPNNISGGGGLNLSTNGSMTYVIDSNTLRDANGAAITLGKFSSGTLLSGRVTNNTIGVAAIANSGSVTGNGIMTSAAGGGTISFTITGNVIHQIAGNSHIWADNTGGSYAANFTITGNTFDTPGAGFFAGIAMTNGAPSSGDTTNVCAVITGNTFNLTGGLGVIVGSSGQGGGHTFNLPGYAGGANLTNVENFIQGNNTGSFTVNAYADAPATAAAFTGVGTGCSTP
jgi:hypothetical protein